MRPSDHAEYLLKQGKTEEELIELGFSKSAITRARRKLKSNGILKATNSGILAKRNSNSTSKRPYLKSRVKQKREAAKKEREKNTLLNILPDLISLVAASRDLGNCNQEFCPHKKGGICDVLYWGNKEEIPEGIGELVPPKEGKSLWYVRPSVHYCALCTLQIEVRLDDIEDEASNTLLWQ